MPTDESSNLGKNKEMGNLNVAKSTDLNSFNL